MSTRTKAENRRIREEIGAKLGCSTEQIERAIAQFEAIGEEDMDLLCKADLNLTDEEMDSLAAIENNLHRSAAVCLIVGGWPVGEAIEQADINLESY